MDLVFTSILHWTLYKPEKRKSANTETESKSILIIPLTDDICPFSGIGLTPSFISAKIKIRNKNAN